MEGAEDEEDKNSPKVTICKTEEMPVFHAGRKQWVTVAFTVPDLSRFVGNCKGSETFWNQKAVVDAECF